MRVLSLLVLVSGIVHRPGGATTELFAQERADQKADSQAGKGGGEAAGTNVSNAAGYDERISDSDREHWAFQPVKSIAIPDVRDRDWGLNPIDAFVLSKLEDKSWRPAADVDRRVLLRRLTFDLTGLPPTLDELDAFVNDSSPDAVERLVDNLLARPSYGERWGRHWLDLVRYAETNGYERDGTKPNVWRYRDYVIESFNRDKPFDRFAREQIAGDEIPDASAETLVALGFHRLGPWDDEPADPKEDRFDQLDDMVSTTSQVFLGLTLGCARCHNHKFEPLTTLDYYRMVAVFNTLKRFQSGRSDLDAPAGAPRELAALAERDRRISEIRGKVEPARIAARRAALDTWGSLLNPDIVAAFRADPAARTPAQMRLVEQHTAKVDELAITFASDSARRETAAAEAEIARLKRETPDPVRAYFLHEPSPNPPTTHVLLRGKATRPGIVAEPGVPTVLAKSQPKFLSSDERTSRRRLSLANWIVDPTNPLTARVIVNRVWQFHFGEGLVRTPSDFGIMGDEPTHPELLDWLAERFVNDGWSIKSLHRLIVTSRTYRMSKQVNEAYLAADPENRLWWRLPYRRLEVEPLRDAMLMVSGRMNSTMGGPGVYPYVPPEALAGHSDPDKIWPAFNEDASSRRTVYAFVKRSLVVPMLEVLDLCDTTKSSAKRMNTSVAPQALTLFNGHFVNQQATRLADRLEATAGASVDDQITLAYRLALSRRPTSSEFTAMRSFLASAGDSNPQQTGPTNVAARRHALEQLCRVILNMNEFAYVD